jgi:hypothetical protein
MMRRRLTAVANARLDRDRWVRERRAEAYIDALAVLGRVAAYVTDPSSRPHPFDAVPGDQWRVFQARVEAFASAAVVALRNDCLGHGTAIAPRWTPWTLLRMGRLLPAIDKARNATGPRSAVTMRR